MSASENEGGERPPTDNRSTPQQVGLNLTDYAAAKRLPVEFLKSIGISDFHYMGHPALRVPYLDKQASEAAIRFRISLTGDKFRWRKGSAPQLYGLERLADVAEPKFLWLVEGESDCHTLWHAEVPALGLPGASHWREERDAQHMADFPIIYVLIEPDSGGETVMAWLGRSEIRQRARLVRLEKTKDVSELWCCDPDRSRFFTALQAAMDASVSWQDAQATISEAEQRRAYETCKRLATAPEILMELELALKACGLVGEIHTAKIVYLATTSRLFDRPVSVVVKGPSSGGKSFVAGTVAKFFPPGAIIERTTLSPLALAYSEEPLSHRMLYLYEAAGMETETGNYVMRSLLSENRVRHETVEKGRDGLKSRLIEREGPTGLIVTTTKNLLHPENETRMLSLTVTDTPEQTKAIMRVQARGKMADAGDVEWHALQTWLEGGKQKVVIPYAEKLADLIPSAAVRLRRDFPTLLSLIAAHALLHRASRDRDADGAIVANVRDYATVRELVADLIAAGVEATVPATIRETVQIVKGAEPLSVTQVAAKLGIDKSAASRRVNDAIGRGYLRNEEERKGHPARLRVGEAMPEDEPILPLADVLNGS